MLTRLIGWLGGQLRTAPAEPSPTAARMPREAYERAPQPAGSNAPERQNAAHGPAADDRGSDPVARYDGLTFGELLDRPDALIVDCETTGLGPRAEIVELAAVDTTGVLRFAAPVMPRSRISSDASDIHGLTRVRLRELEAKPWPEHHVEVHALLDGQLVIGWNVEFDVRLIRQTCERYGLEPPRVAWSDVLAFYRKHGPERRSYRLGNVLRAEGLRREGSAHRAEADARAVLAIMRKLADYPA